MRKAPLNRVPLARRIQVISCLVEGNSIRSPERMTGTHRDTICLLLVEIGDGRAKLMGAAMRIHNLYEDTDGELHFRDVGGRLGFELERLPATGIVFRETTADYENSWHRAPRRQYVISLAGGISITAILRRRSPLPRMNRVKN